MKKNQISQKLLPLGILCIIALSSCAKYSPKPLALSHGVIQTQTDINVCAHTLSRLDCKYYFSRDINRKGYKAIQLSIINRSKSDYILNADTITLQLEPLDSVMKKLHLNTSKRVVTWLIPSLLFWPVIIPSAVDGVKSQAANKELNCDFQQRALDTHSKIIIPAQKTINRVFFITKDNYQQSFSCKIENQKSKKQLDFDITI